MDDIYFSDKKKKPERDSDANSRRRSSDSFIDTDYFDEDFNLDFKKSGASPAFSQKSKFSVTLPEDELPDETPTDRTPKGRPVSSVGDDYTAPEYKSRVVEETGVFSGNGEVWYGKKSNMPSQDSKPHQSKPSSPSRTPQPRTPQSRTPQGARLNAQGSQRPAARPSGGSSSGKRPPQKPPKSKKKIIAFAVLGVLVVILGAIFGLGLSALSGLNYDDSIVENAYVDEGTLMSSKDVTNILFIGSDARGDVEGNRSDTMMLFSIDKQNKKLKLTSFLRDSYVYIPSKQYNTKLNAAFSYGGTQLVMDTIEYNFGVKIDNYLMVDFKAFRQLINLLGGITVEGVTAAEAKYMRDEVDLTDIVEGTNVMNGKEALWYCRIRYVDNDFKRTERQRKVITAIIAKALRTNPVKLMNIVKEVLPNISTDISQSELMSLAMGAALQYIHYDIEQQQIPAKGTWSDARINGQAVLKMDIYENADILKSFLYDKDSKKDVAESK